MKGLDLERCALSKQAEVYRAAFNSTLSFMLMGSLTGLLVGAIDATSAIDAGLSLLFGATGLHVIAGGAVGALIGLFYEGLPDSLKLARLIEELRAWLLPAQTESVYHRGKVLSILWGMTLLFPVLASVTLNALGEPLSQIRTPLFKGAALALAAQQQTKALSGRRPGLGQLLAADEVFRNERHPQ